MVEHSNGARTTHLPAYIVHHIPGRLRLKIPGAKGRADLLEQIATAASAAAKIESIECSPITGSVLINYASSAYKKPEEVVAALGDCAPRISIHASRPTADARSQRARRKHSGPSAAAEAISSFFGTLDYEIREVTENEFDLKVLLPMVAGGLGLFALRRRGTTPLWLTLLIFAFQSFLTLHGVAVMEGAEAVNIGTNDETTGE